MNVALVGITMMFCCGYDMKYEQLES